MKRIRWKANFFDNSMMRDNDNYTNYGLRSNISVHQNPDFENDIYDMVGNIEFRKVRNDFQDKLKEAINEILSPKNFMCFSRQVNKPVQNVRHRLQQTFR